MLGCLRLEVALSSFSSSGDCDIERESENESYKDRMEEGSDGGNVGRRERRKESQIGRIDAGPLEGDEDKVTDRVHRILKSGETSEGEIHLDKRSVRETDG